MHLRVAIITKKSTAVKIATTAALIPAHKMQSVSGTGQAAESCRSSKAATPSQGSQSGTSPDTAELLKERKPVLTMGVKMVYDGLSLAQPAASRRRFTASLA